MRDAQKLRDQWEADQSMRADWYQMLNSPAWQAISSLIEAEAIELAETYDDKNHGDPVLARRLSQLKGARWALMKLQSACDPKPAPAPEITEYAHINPIP